jgi:hypothetical protein
MKMKTYRVTVRVKRLVRRKDLDSALDKNVAGHYQTVFRAPNKKEAKEFGLDSFHETFPIHCLDNFNISVKAKRVKE